MLGHLRQVVQLPWIQADVLQFQFRGRVGHPPFPWGDADEKEGGEPPPGIQRINAFMVLIDAKCAHGVED